MKIVTKDSIKDARLQPDDQMVLSSIEDILADIKTGKPVIIVDDEDRENEGDLIIAAEMATAENINFMAKEGRGLICLPMERPMIEHLELEQMGRGDNAHHRTAFTVSIEAKEGVTTGISAADRAHTIKTAIDPKTTPADIATPGHVFPLQAKDGGVLVRAGHTEAAVDLAKMAGFSGAGVICEIMNDDGTMARLPDLVAYAQRHGLKIGTIADLIAYRRRTDTLVKQVYSGKFDSSYGGEYTMKVYRNTLTRQEHIALVKGNLPAPDAQVQNPVLVRMHAVDILVDILGERPDSSLYKAMDIIDQAGSGVIVLLRDTHPDGLSKKLGAAPKDVPRKQELKDYGIGAQILRDLGVSHMKILSNTEKNIIGLEGYGLSVAGFEKLDA